MSFSVPPDRSTARIRGRLRPVVAVATAILSATLGAPGSARPAPVRVLIGTSVSEPARSTMPPALWAKIVASYVNAEAVGFDGEPSLDDCHKAKAAYMVFAPFDLRPRLPGMVSSSGRVAARTRIVVTNCVTGEVAYDQAIPLDSDPPSSANAGDFEAVPETSWSRVVPQEMARYPVFFPRVSRIKSIQPPFAYIDTIGGLYAVGDTLRAFASADASRKTPILLTVTATDGKYLQVVFSTVNGAPAPEVGDYVEPVPKPSPSATPGRP
jgi:hypothetical protein